MKTTALLFVLLSLTLGSLWAQSYPYPPPRGEREYGEARFPYQPQPYEPSPYEPGPSYPERIQVALLLDVSGSMEGLLSQARQQLWHIVNGLMLDVDHHPPRLEMAVYEYGKDRLGHRQGYLRQVLPFTYDLDLVSESLYRLYTGGSREYAGEAISRAVQELHWSPNPRDRKLLYLAGNETIYQGPTSVRDAMYLAQRYDITVHTIFCGSYQQGVRFGWEEAAYLGGGAYLTIEQNYQPRYEASVYDRELTQLSDRFNHTYVFYGPQAAAARDRQLAADRHAALNGTAYSGQRALAKASGAYQVPDWDLVDAVAAGKVDLARVPTQQLPAEMRGMSLPEKQAYLARKRSERERLSQEIRAKAQAQGRQPQATSTSRPTQPQPAVGKGATVEPPRTLDEAIRESVNTRRPVAAPARPRQSPAQPASVQPTRPQTQREAQPAKQAPVAPTHRLPAQPVRSRRPVSPAL